MPFIKIYIHFIWDTKKKLSFLAIKEIRKTVWNHIRENANKKGIRIDFINGYSDHNHCLIALKENQTIENVMEILKGEKNFLFNSKGVAIEPLTTELPPFLDTGTTKKSVWENDNFTIAINETMFDRISNYNRIQEQRNSEKIINKKYTEYLIRYGFQKFDDK